MLDATQGSDVSPILPRWIAKDNGLTVEELWKNRQAGLTMALRAAANSRPRLIVKPFGRARLSGLG